MGRMTELLLAIDPGGKAGTSGWSTWAVDPDVPMARLDYGLVKGGRKGWLVWMSNNIGVMHPDITVCEKFKLDGRTKFPDIGPVYIEGQIEAIYDALSLEVVWQTTDMKALVSDAILKRAGLWLFGSDPAISWIDANDVNDSQRHALAWASANDHEPTIEWLHPNV